MGVSETISSPKTKSTPVETLQNWGQNFVNFWKNHAWLAAVLSLAILFHIWLHLANPYAAINFVQQPFTTKVENGAIVYDQQFDLKVLSDPLSDKLGYYRQGFLIVQNNFVGGKRIDKSSASEIIDEIHRLRFDPSKPYLISGDQFSVLYPRNLGVFYNQLLDPETAHSEADWLNRQRIYLQSALFAIEGLSASDVPKTTLIPIGPRTITATQVHPGDVASDSPYGLLYALKTMQSDRCDQSKKYCIQTKQSIERILKEKGEKLRHIVESYEKTVRDTETGFIRTDIKLSGARDGATRKSSFFDNVVLWKTLSLANELGIQKSNQADLDKLKNDIKNKFWNDSAGYYNNDSADTSFSSDWLIGYVTGFFDLKDKIDFERSKRTISYINREKIAEPLPIKYQAGKPKDMPIVIKWFVPSYGGDAIWSYWGAEYMTLLMNMYQKDGDSSYKDLVKKYREAYDKAIVRDGGFAETFSPDGQFLQNPFYKSIRTTGWVVQYEHAVKLLETSAASPLP